jgi:hypothetical protein
VLHSNSVNSKVGEASLLRCNSVNSKKEQNKPNPVQSKPQIPSFDPMKLLENMKTNPFDLDPLTKIMMKSDRDQRLAKKAM